MAARGINTRRPQPRRSARRVRMARGGDRQRPSLAANYDRAPTWACSPPVIRRRRRAPARCSGSCLRLSRSTARTTRWPRPRCRPCRSLWIFRPPDSSRPSGRVTHRRAVRSSSRDPPARRGGPPAASRSHLRGRRPCAGARPRRRDQDQAGVPSALRQAFGSERAEVLDVVGDDATPLRARNLEEDRVAAPYEPDALGNGDDVMASLTQQRGDPRGKLLAYQCPHARSAFSPAVAAARPRSYSSSLASISVSISWRYSP